MSVSRMEKLTAVVPKEKTDALLHALMRMRAVSLIEQGPATGAVLEVLGGEHVEELSALAQRIDAVLPVLTKRSKRKKSLFRQRVPIVEAEFYANGSYELALKVVSQAEQISKKMKELREERERYLSFTRAYTPYLDWEPRLDFDGTAHTVAFLGSLPGGTSTDLVLQTLEGRAAVVSLINADRTGLYVLVTVHKEEQEQTLRALSGIGFTEAELPARDGTAKELFDRYDAEGAACEKKLESLERRLFALAERLDEVEVLSDLVNTSILREKNKSALSATEACTLLCAWCPEEHKARVTALLERLGGAYDFAPPEEDEQPPVLLKNNAFARNFEWVLGMYAYPAYGKFDPTFVMSIFYMLIFGLMFADAGYGLFLSVVCFAVVRWCNPPDGMKRFLLMFGYCGLSCILFGILFGSYFGDFPLAFLRNVVGVPESELPNLALLPSAAANVAVLFDPLQNPMGFLVVSLAVGAVHLIAGMAVQAYILCRRGKVLAAIFDVGSYWVLFAGIGVVFLHKTAGIALLIGGVLMILLTQGRSRKGIAGKLIGGFGGLYALINYASDLLSYSRILALGLAAGVVGQVVNILATLKGASFIGIIMMLVVFALGHLLNLVINVLGTFVHTSRLQYIEFLGKFYEDGGERFEPIAVAERYSQDVTPEGELLKTK